MLVAPEKSVEIESPLILDCISPKLSLAPRVKEGTEESLKALYSFSISCS